MTLYLESPAFRDGGRIPRRHSCEGDDLSPALTWSGLPAGCRSLALVCEDPDAPGGTWHHWAIFDVPASERGLREGMPTDERVGAMRQAINDFRRVGYGGPCPPPGHGPHRYRFRLLALAVKQLDVPDRPTCKAVAAAAGRQALAETVLTGRYERP